MDQHIKPVELAKSYRLLNHGPTVLVSAAAGAAGRIAEILAVKPKIVAPAQPTPAPARWQGRIAFEHVRFAYPTAPDKVALSDLTFTVAPGERVAIVGPSGAGKSTIFALLLRFYDVDSGAISLDGVDVRALDPRDAVLQGRQAGGSGDRSGAEDGARREVRPARRVTHDPAGRCTRRPADRA